MASGGRSGLARRLCKNCSLLKWQKLHSTPKCSFSAAKAKFNKGLREDNTWEAEVLRHEKYLDILRKKGIPNLELPTFERDNKVQDLPHLMFKEPSEMKHDESLIDLTSKIILGHIGSEGFENEVKNIPNGNNCDPDFIRDDVQTLLQRLQYRCNVERVYKPAVAQRKTMPSVKYLTDEQLEEERKIFYELMKEKIRMPLVMMERAPCDSTLSNDSILDGYEDSNVTFVDISEDVSSNRERFVVIRQPDGILRKASWEERDRLMQVYFPIAGRQTVPSLVFKDEHLKTALKHKLHENVLDQCVIQFDPDSPDYIRVFTQVYKDIDDNRLYNSLRSTRYFSGLAFYLAQNGLIDGLLHDMLNRGLLEDAVDVVKLFTLLHPESKTASQLSSDEESDSAALVEVYIESDSQDMKALSSALQNLKSSQSHDKCQS